MPNLSRRYLVTTAAALPALAIAAAVPAVAATEAVRPVSIVAKPSTSKLLALGDELRLLFPEWLKLEPKIKALHEQAMKAAGYDELGMDRTDEQQKTADAKFDEATARNGYSQHYKRLNVLSNKMWKLSRSILRIPADDRRGDRIRAAAALVLDSDSDGYEAGQLLWEMAAGAGFAVPPEVAKKLRRMAAAHARKAVLS